MKPTIISRRQFLVLSGTATAALMLPLGINAAPDASPLIRFGMLSDIHYAGREAAPPRYYRQSLEKVKECIDLMNREKVDFVIELGDFKDQDPVPNEANTLKYLSDIENVFHQFNGLTYHVLGNHDMDGISKEQFLSRVVNTGIPATESYYSFNLKGLHFVVLDGNFTREGTAYDHGNFTWDNTRIPEAELNWLKEDLKANELPAIVFIHQMLDDSKSKEQSVHNAAEVRQVLEQSGKVICVFQGHVHEERYSLINNIHYYSMMAVVDNEGPENNSYMIAGIYPDGSLAIDGYRRASDQKFNKA
ncbi:MAG: metallophosphoesterase [Bacteroidales bacterium]